MPHAKKSSFALLSLLGRQGWELRERRGPGLPEPALLPPSGSAMRAGVVYVKGGNVSVGAWHLAALAMLHDAKHRKFHEELEFDE
eukprot:1619235-Alexandrium_andersonii.AAC.1